MLAWNCDFRQTTADLAASLLDLCSALTDLELRVALANHVDSATSLDDLAIGVAVFQRTNAADYFHRIDLNRCIVYGLVCFFPIGKDAEYTVCLNSFNAKRRLPSRLRESPGNDQNRLF